MPSKVCAVLGYGPGLGDAVARRWSSQGFKVAILSRNFEKLTAAAQGIPNAKPYKCDVSQASDIEAAMKAIESDLGPINTLVYNAGSGVWKTFDKIELDQFDLSMKINAHGLLKAAQVVTPGMIERKEGNIMITGATASLRGKPFTAGFAPSKGAQRLLAQSLARDLGPKGIHVAYFIIDGQIGVDDKNAEKIDRNAIAEMYWNVTQQPKTCWTFELDVRPNVENW